MIEITISANTRIIANGKFILYNAINVTNIATR